MVLLKVLYQYRAAMLAVLLPLLLWAIWLAGEASGRAAAELQAEADLAKERERAALVLLEAQGRVRQVEQQARREAAARDQLHQEQMKNVEDDKARVLRAHADGAVRLSVPVKRAECRASQPAASGAAGAGDPAPRAELSGAAAEFLVGLASDADKVALELNRCADRVALLERLMAE